MANMTYVTMPQKLLVWPILMTRKELTVERILSSGVQIEIFCLREKECDLECDLFEGFFLDLPLCSQHE